MSEQEYRQALEDLVRALDEVAPKDSSGFRDWPREWTVGGWETALDRAMIEAERVLR